ncbi:MAG: glucose-6-phosphate isomerase [Sphaerochaetaceae bacterium]|nr:glucose-6-phosphate isomerase [Sphaerochaetaceae bacterium]MDC7247762.1 glucose-6-phosphate isomerase [Sphaerochaetaceae bacterium]
MKFIDLDKTESFAALQALFPVELRTILNEQRIRSSQIPLGGDLIYNYSAMPVEEEHLKVLCDLAEEQEVIEKYKELLSGQVMNPGENRLVLHQLTRKNALKDNIVIADSTDKEAFYSQQLEKVYEFASKVREKKIVGSTGKPFTTVVQIGIGGSDLGPRAMYLAMEGWAQGEGIETIDARFISNVDPDDAKQVLQDADIESTLFILVSKSGTTQETLTNFELVKKTMEEKRIAGFDSSRHLVAVTSNTSPLASSDDVMDAFYIDDYIGGRYSSTSAVGALVLSLAFGKEVVSQFLEGAHEADIRALETDPLKNGALLDALIGVYLRNVLNMPTTAILPYSQALSRFPAHLQQLDMESNGKSVNREGKSIHYPTGPIIFGEPGTNGQHSFYQLLHQGTDSIPLQFIGFKENQRKYDIETEGSTSQDKLLANLIAQIVAFALGKEDENGNKRFSGNRFSSLIYGSRLTPKNLGALLAHYENKVMFQGFIWNINSFDQEGVQLGKVLAKKVLSGAQGDTILRSFMKILL